MTEKNILPKGMSRVPRRFLLPVEVLAFFVFIAGMICLLFILSNHLFGGIFFSFILWLVIVLLTWNDPKTIQYFRQFFKRNRKFNSSYFKGVSFDTSPSHISKNTAGFKSKKQARKEVLEHQNLPYEKHINEYIIQTKQGNLLSFIKFDGINFKTKTEEELENFKKLLASVIKSLDPKLMVYTYYFKKEVKREDNSIFFNLYPKIQQKIINKYSEKNEKFYETDVYVVLEVRKIDPNSLSKKASEIKDLLSVSNKSIEKLISELRKSVNVFQDSLKDAKPYLLKVKTGEGGLFYSEPMAFLSRILNLNEKNFPIINESISDYISSTRKVFKKNGEIKFYQSNGTIKIGFIYTILAHKYSGATTYDILDRFLGLDCEYVLCSSFALMSAEKSLKLLGKKQAQYYITEDRGYEQQNQLEQFEEELIAYKTSLGLFEFKILVYGDEADTSLIDRLDAVSSAFYKLGQEKKEDILAEATYWSMLPSNNNYAVRGGVITIENYADICSLHNIPKGNKINNHWGEYLAILKTQEKTKYYFNMHQGDLGHLDVQAKSGSGKTASTNYLLSLVDKYLAKVFHFDYLYSASNFIMAMGGEYHDLLPNIKTNWNPCLLEDTPVNRNFLSNLLCYLGRRENISYARKSQEEINFDMFVTVSEFNMINNAIDSMYRMSNPRLRNLGELVKFLGTANEKESNLRHRLSKWVGNGAYANVFDNEEDCFDFSSNRYYGFETSHIANNEEFLFASMMYIFHRIDIEMSKNEPFIVVIEEGQNFVRNPMNVRWLKEMLTTYRRRNGVVIFVSPVPEIIAENPSLKQQFATSIFLCNDQLNPETYRQLGCNSKEIQILKQNPKAHMGQMLIKTGSETVLAEMDLKPYPELLSILSGTEKTKNEIQQLIQKYGKEPEQWLFKFLESKRSML